MAQPSRFECFCGDAFPTRDALVDHNVEEHDMARDESRDKVMQKYPE